MKITIKVIPHEFQRYSTVGDYVWETPNHLKITVSDTGNYKMNMCIALHELVEALLAQWNGIKEEDITDFDVQYEKDRLEGKYRDDEEPGFHPDAPYLKEHTIATAIEMMFAAHAGISWPQYSETVNNL